jgi:hypothetical protein
MNNLENTLRGIKALVTAKTIKGTSFVGVRGYENSKGEISNQTLLVGFNYANMLKKDFEKLVMLDIKTVIEKYGKEVTMAAYKELLTSLAKLTATEQEKEELTKKGDSTMNRSNGQTDAFITLAKGIKQHKETGKIYVTGLGVAKTVLAEGVYPTVNSRPKTLAKKEIKKLANLSNDKIRRFTFSDVSVLKLQGVTV